MRWQSEASSLSQGPSSVTYIFWNHPGFYRAAPPIESRPWGQVKRAAASSPGVYFFYFCWFRVLSLFFFLWSVVSIADMNSTLNKSRLQAISLCNRFVFSSLPLRLVLRLEKAYASDYCKKISGVSMQSQCDREIRDFIKLVLSIQYHVMRTINRWYMWS